jgi:co-chaperonin GroES (HSP10)
MTKIVPLGKLILVQETEETESVSAGGLIIASTTEKILKKGIVVKVGIGERSGFNGEIYPVDIIKEGMTVYYSPNHATEIIDQETKEKYYFINSGVLFGYESIEDTDA